MDVVLNPGIVSFHSRYEQNSNYRNTVQRQSFNQLINNNSTKDKSSGSSRLLRTK